MTHARYSRLAIALHWMIAVALSFQLALGWRLEELEQGIGQFAAYQLHKTVGIAILLASLARLVLRWFKPPPPPLPDSLINLLLARLVHWGFYLVMIGGPLTGWALVSTAKVKVPTLLFGVLPWPHLPLAADWNGVASDGHELLAILGVALFVLHVAGALRHQFIKQEALLQRMLPAALAGMGGMALILVALSGSHAAGWLWPFAAPGDAPVSASRVPSSDPGEMADVAGEATNSVAPEALEVPDEAANASAGDAPLPAVQAPPVSPWQVAPGGQLRFTARWNGAPVPGRFNSWGADIRFSPDDLKASRIRVTVDLGSVSTAEAHYTESLKGADFFDVAAHPQAVFTASSIAHQGDDHYRANGMLNLHGVSRPLTLNFTLKIKGDQAEVLGTAILDRTTFGVGKGDWAKTDQIAGAVDIDFAFKARRTQ